MPSPTFNNRPNKRMQRPGPALLVRRRPYKPRFALAASPPSSQRGLQTLAVTLVVTATLYNAMLAIVNAHLHRLGSSAVVMSEIAILGLGLLLIARSGVRQGDGPHIGLLTGYIILALISSIAVDRPFPDPIRNFAIIAIFAILGRRAEQRDVEKAFLIVTLFTLTFLALEMTSTSLFVTIFQPDTYYEATRGHIKSDFNDTGLVGNALGFASRFSFGIFTDHRTSSVFLEQVSLANYAGVLGVYLVSFWKRIKWHSRLIHLGTIILILVSNNTRTSSGLVAILLIGYFVFPLIPRFATLAVAPTLILSAFFIIGNHPVYGEDDLLGRLSITVNALHGLTLFDLLGLHIQASELMYDTGYGYIFTSTGLAGAVMLWLYVSLIVPGVSMDGRRCAFGLSLYIFLNMLIGGNAIYSMKVAALLWFLVGFMGSKKGRPTTNSSIAR